MVKVTRHFIDVGGRRMHYRRAGNGPPLVLLHGSPGSSAMMDREIAAAAPDFTCFALDTPGFGDSDAIAGDTLQVQALARVIAETIAAIGIAPCPVYGTHTGAAIALELGASFPEAASGLVLDGVPIFTDAELESWFSAYFQPLTLDPLGGHLTATWMRFRDQFTWFPWNARDRRNLNSGNRPSAELIERWVAMFYRSWRTYRPAYRAACHYGQGAVRAAARLTLPTIYMATSNDMLHAHLDRLPPLKDGQRIERLEPGLIEKAAAVARFATELPPGRTPPAPDTRLVGDGPAKQFVDAGSGQLLVRSYGDRARPAILLAHDTPGSGSMHDALARRLAASHHVLVPDLPGSGDSPEFAGDVLHACATALAALPDALGIGRCTLAAIGCSAGVAALAAARAGNRFDALLLDRSHAPDPAVAAAIAPELTIMAEGAHWVTAWLLVRDREIYEPWFDGRVAAQRRDQGNFDAEWLHEQAFELMKARTSYHLLPRAAWTFDPTPVLAKLAIPVRVAEGRDLASLVFTD